MQWSLAFVILCTITPSPAQRSTPIKVDSNQDLAKVVSRAQRYRFPDFREGQVLYGKGKLSEVHLFNYDILLGAVCWIDEKQDTLVVSDERAFHYVAIGKEVFYHDDRKGYMEILADKDSVRLAVKDEFVLQAPGSQRSRPTSYWFWKDQKLFLIDKEDRIFKATKTRILQFFPGCKNDLKAFIHQNKTDFNKKDDLLKVFGYCSTLQ